MASGWSLPQQVNILVVPTSTGILIDPRMRGNFSEEGNGNDSALEIGHVDVAQCERNSRGWVCRAGEGAPKTTCNLKYYEEIL